MTPKIIYFRTPVCPVIVTTGEALTQALSEPVRAVYVDEYLAARLGERLSGLAAPFGFTEAEKKGKHGVFLLRTAGEPRFDPKRHEISDPFDIL